MISTHNASAMAAIALGSNLGNPLAMVKGAVEVLVHEATTEIVAQSHWYQTIAIGPAQPDYVNGCVVVKTKRSPLDLLHLLMTIEQQFGRQRTEHWGPRTLDLDLLLYDNLVLETPELSLPHPHMGDRAFVLLPLAELLPDWMHPVTGLNHYPTPRSSRLYRSYFNTLPMTLEPFELIEQQLFVRSRKFSYETNRIRLPNGVEGDWSCVRHPGGALAVPVTPDGELVLVKQYRFALQRRILEFPAGTVEVKEDPFSTIEREIQEETGYLAHRWTNLGQFPLAPGYSDELIYAFLAQDLERLKTPPAQDEDEDIEVILMTPADFEAAVHRGESIDAKSIAAYFLARPYLGLI